ncbi:M48 family metalloprotease [Roseofilum casamattae]|uniref:M48 family metalloprotease n=1 Tax=Roseofilum casamattae BLCC-M143 TaxID=3022442 RepID=A0ABT7BZ55_9CYAN|nr:M48 family metallopeptidase [Roseofilum casamattae]MDJ1184465.1 M48 family metalloprotease [Roseofilum casamattae BLCC-M143]
MKNIHQFNLPIASLLLFLFLGISLPEKKVMAHFPVETTKQVTEESAPSATDADVYELPTEADDAESNLETEEELTDPYEILVKADLLYTQGNFEEAERLYRLVKEPFPEQEEINFNEPVYEIEELYDPETELAWQEIQTAWNGSRKEKRGLAPVLNEFIETNPEFIPARLLLSDVYFDSKQRQEGLETLEQLVNTFPNSIEVVRSHIAALEKRKKYLEASISARQYAIVNSEDDAEIAAEMTEVADKNFDRFQRQIKDQMVGQGVAGTALRVGGCWLLRRCNPVGAVIGDTLSFGALMLQGESGIGKRAAQSYSKELDILENEEILEYVTEIGNDLAELMGRDEFEYEFYVVKDDAINAFALPGGKIFINTGIILNTNSEAELAGLIAHELAHTVLSHGFDGLVRGQLFNNVGQIVNSALGSKFPIGTIISNLVDAKYNRAQERQADIVGTRVIANAGYAADGVRNLMVTLEEKGGGSHTPELLSTHPATEKRVRYLEALIQRKGYNRYAYEGVEKHAQMQALLE